MYDSEGSLSFKLAINAGAGAQWHRCHKGGFISPLLDIKNDPFLGAFFMPKYGQKNTQKMTPFLGSFLTLFFDKKTALKKG